jgi:O-antigen/teichoic acid export membrane protein
LALTGSFFATLISAVPLIAFYVFSTEIMGVFSPEFTKHGIVLQLLLIGQASNITLGWVGHLLIMIDKESLYKQAMIVSSIISFSIILLLSIKYGLIGCAAATATSYWISNIILFLMYFKS